MNEIHILQNLEHSNICSLHEMFIDKHHIYLVMEYYTGKTLLDTIVALDAEDEKF